MNRTFQPKKSETGFTLLEVLVAIVILAAGILVVLTMTRNQLNELRSLRERRAALTNIRTHLVLTDPLRSPIEGPASMSPDLAPPTSIEHDLGGPWIGLDLPPQLDQQFRNVAVSTRWKGGDRSGEIEVALIQNQ